jgi:hypothetical protein
MSSPEYLAGAEYKRVSAIVSRGFAVGVLAAHITWMLGDNEWQRPIWRERAVPPDGKTFTTRTFDQYLLRPAREGLRMPSLLTVQKLCEADPKHGARAIGMLCQEIPNYDERIKTDRQAVFATAAGLADHLRGAELEGTARILRIYFPSSEDRERLAKLLVAAEG